MRNLGSGRHVLYVIGILVTARIGSGTLGKQQQTFRMMCANGSVDDRGKQDKRHTKITRTRVMAVVDRGTLAAMISTTLASPFSATRRPVTAAPNADPSISRWRAERR
jgi:hypothetical protein